MVTYITVFTIIVIMINLFYWYYFFNGLTKLNVKDSSKSATKPVSVVICSRNAEKELEHNIPYLLKQNYPDFEILIIDDDSEDNTADLLKRMQIKERYLNIGKVIKNKPGKKEALAAGIVKSRHYWLLFTDVDCLPESSNWINTMMNTAAIHNSQIVLGYSPYSNSGSFLHHWIHFEGWLTGLQYLSYANRGLPYMGVGRNILYDKSLLKPEVLKKHEDLSSGDDDLTVNQLATSDNCNVCISKESFVETSPSNSWVDYLRQKRRHFSTAHRYRNIHKVLLGLYSVSHFSFFVFLFILCLHGHYLFALAIYLIRLVILIPPVILLMKKLNATFTLWMFPLFDFGQSLFYMLFSFSVFLPQKNKW